jgi:hypothetical protein
VPERLCVRVTEGVLICDRVCDEVRDCVGVKDELREPLSVLLMDCVSLPVGTCVCVCERELGTIATTTEEAV